MKTVIAAACLLLASCGGPLTTCNVQFGEDQFFSGPRCPANTVLVGSGNGQITCATITVACPLEGK